MRSANIAFIRNSADAIGREAAHFLLGQGHARSYAFLHSDPVTDWSRARFAAFKRELNDSGLWCEELFAPDAATKLKRPAAVLAANDDRAFDLVKVLAVRRIAVPREVTVLGVDNDAHLRERESAPFLGAARLRGGGPPGGRDPGQHDARESA